MNASQLVTGSQVSRAICARVFSCTTKFTVSGSSVLPPLWSKCVWVLMTVVIGLSVIPATWAMMSCPYPLIFVSTSATPSAMTQIAVFPPPPIPCTDEALASM